MSRRIWAAASARVPSAADGGGAGDLSPMAVSNTPRRTTTTRMPAPSTSWVSASLRASSPNLDAL